MKRKKILIVLAVSLFALWGGICLWGRAGLQYTDNAYIQGDVTAIAPKVSGYVAAIPIEDNAEVRQGDVLFRIDDLDYKVKAARAESEVTAAGSAAAEAAAAIKLQEHAIAEAEAKLVSARALQKQKEHDYLRQKNLLKTKVTTDQKFEESERDKIQAEASTQAARANLEVQKVRLELLTAQLQSARAALSQARQNLKLAEIDLENTIVRAPVDGVVGNRKVQVGRYLSPGVPVLSIVPLKSVWAVANFKETQLARLEVGQEVEIQVDGYEKIPLRGRIDGLSPGSGSAFSLMPPDNATGNFVRVVQRVPVKIAIIDNPLQDRLVPGLSLRVKVNLRPDAKRAAHGLGKALSLAEASQQNRPAE